MIYVEATVAVALILTLGIMWILERRVNDNERSNISNA